MMMATRLRNAPTSATSFDPESGQSNLLEAVQQALNQTGISWLRRVAVDAIGTKVILSGMLPSYYFKQIAQTAAMKVSGVGSIQNELQVIEPGHPCG